MNNPTIIIQARMSSGRLPGKVMLPLAGHEVLSHVVMRCRQSKKAKNVVVATSTDMSDDIIADFCKTHGFPVFRGDLHDVLARYYEAAKAFHADPVIRVTSDCPLIDPQVIDGAIAQFEHAGVDYVGNTLHRTFPRGLDCEVFSFQALEEAHRHATQPREQEHVTPYIIEHATKAPYVVDAKYEGDFRLTLDEEDDYRLLKELFERGITDVPTVIEFLRHHTDIASINAHVQQKS